MSRQMALQQLKRSGQALACIMLLAATARAQVATVTAIGNISGTLPSVYGVATDSAGNIYAVNAGSGTNTGTLVEYPANGAAPIVIATGLQNPRGVTVDSAGNLFVSQVANNTIERFAAGSTTGTAFVSSGLNTPVQMGTDAANNLYIADYGNNRILEVTPGGTATPITNSAFNASKGLAVDAAGNLFVANSGTNTIIKIPAGSKTATVLPFTGLNKPLGVALDAAGDVFVADMGNNRIVELPAGATAQVVVGTGTGLNTPYGLAVDRRGTVLVANNGTGQILALRTGGADLGSAAYKTASALATLTFNFNSSASVASIAFLTQGVAASDFKDGKTGDTCVAGTYAAGSSCVLSVSLTPTQVGPRAGAVELLNAAGQALSTTYLRGAGQGTSLTVDPGTQTVFGSGLGMAQGIAIDAAGNVYASDSTAGKVYVFAAGTGTATTVISGLSAPQGITLDGAGNLLIADNGDSRIIKVPLEGTALNAADASTVTTAIASPTGIAASGAGDIYVTTTNGSQVSVISGSTGAISLLGSGLSVPQAIAVDVSGNIFVADQQNNQVVEFSPNGAVLAKIGNIATPSGIAVDPAGTVYVTDVANNRLLRIASSAGVLTAGSATPVATGITRPGPLAIDLQGNLYTVSSGASVVTVVSRQVAAVNFGTVKVSQTSTPAAVSINNAGNAPLPLATPVYTEKGSPADFTIVPATTLGCSAGASLASGTLCSYSTAFTPVAAGSFTDTSSFAATTTIASSASALLSGSTMAATTLSLAVTQPASGTPVYGQPVQITATLTSTTAGIAGGTVTFTVDTVAQTPVSVSGGTAVLALPSLSGGPHTISATYSGDGFFAASSTTSALNFSVSALGTVTSLTASPTSIISGSPVTLTATTTVPSNTALTAVGSVIFYDGTTALQTVPLNAQGIATLTTSALAGGTRNIYAAFQATPSFSGSASSLVVVTVKVRTFTSLALKSATPFVFVGQTASFTATLSGSTGGVAPTGSITFLDGSTSLGSVALGATPVANFSTSMLGVGSHTITAVYGGDTNYSPSTAAAFYLNEADFAVSVTPASVTIVNRGTGAATVSVSSAGGYTGNVAFQCTGLPAYATCVFSPASLNVAGSSAQTVPFVIQTLGGPAMSAMGGQPRGLLGLLGGLLCLISAALLPSLRSKLARRLPLLSMIACGLLLCTGAMSGCASLPALAPATPAGTYMVTISATDATNVLTHTSPMTLVVTQ